MARLYWFAYPTARKSLRSPSTGFKLVDRHRTRDGVSFCELSPLALGAGHSYGGVIFNFPGIPYSGKDLTDRDMLLQTTRPPLSDLTYMEDESGEQASLEKMPNRRVVDRSESDLESKIFKALRDTFFEAIDRGRLVLGPNAHKQATLHSVYVSQKTAEVTEYRYDDKTEKPTAKPGVTIGVAVSIPAGTYLDFNFVAVFGMSGMTGLTWSVMIRNGWPLPFIDLLGGVRPRLVISEFPIPETIPVTTAGWSPATGRQLLDVSL